MARARGRRNPTRPGGFVDPGPDSPLGREIGESARQDPAGSPINSNTGNIVNHETGWQEVPTGEPLAEFRGPMAHGVPPELDTTAERAEAERGPQHARRGKVSYERPAERPPAVPVYIVEEHGGPEVFRTAYPRHITVPNTANDPVRVCGRGRGRNRIALLNEDATTDVRFAQSPAGLAGGGGALLTHGLTAYQWFETQDELYAQTISASLTVVMSVIEEFEQGV